MKSIGLFLLLVSVAFSMKAQSLSNIAGDYCIGRIHYIQINEDYTFTLSSSGLCAGVTADGNYKVHGDTLTLSTRYHNRPWDMTVDATKTISNDSVLLVFRDKQYSFIEYVWVYYRDSDYYIPYRLDSTQSVRFSESEIARMERLYYDFAVFPPFNIKDWNIKPNSVYIISTVNPCYPILDNVDFFVDEKGLFRFIDIDGTKYKCHYTKSTSTDP